MATKEEIPEMAEKERAIVIEKKRPKIDVLDEMVGDLEEVLSRILTHRLRYGRIHKLMDTEDDINELIDKLESLLHTVEAGGRIWLAR